MKPWRERIAEARERGGFTGEDHRLIGDFQTCMVAEAGAVLGQNPHRLYPILEKMGGNTWWPNQIGPLWSVSNNLFDTAEDRLNQIEDRVLQLKREHTA